MTNRGWSRGILISAVVLAVALMTSTAFAANRYVKADGICVGFSPCHTTINAALSAAGDGDTVYVFPGTYVESVNIDRIDGNSGNGDISLIAVNASGSPSPGGVTIDGDNDDAIGTDDSGEGDPHDGNVTIDGFVLKSDEDGIDLEVDGEVTIRNVTANGIGDGDDNDHGIEIYCEGGPVTIADSTANNTDEGDGVKVDSPDGADVTVTDCTASNNSNDDDADGFDINTQGGDVRMEDCTASGNHDEGIEIDGYDDEDDLDRAGKVILIRCTANNNGMNDDNEGDGISIRCAGNVTITDCTANGNKGCDGDYYADGIEIDAAKADVTITGTTANDNHDKGIRVEYYDDDDGDAGANNVTITGCTANSNGQECDESGDGIYIGADGRVTIAECTTNDNHGDGIDVEDNVDTEIRDCTAENNGKSGIETDSGGFTLVERCRLIDNAGRIEGNNDAGLEVDAPDGNADPPELNTGVTVSCCDFDGNRQGLHLNDDFVGEVKATGNWWGDSSGPSGIGPGSGDSIVIASGGVGTATYDPWLKQSAAQTPGCGLRPIPTLSAYGIGALALLMAGAAFLTARRRRNAG